MSAGIPIEKTGSPRVKHGAGLVKHGMTNKVKELLTQVMSQAFFWRFLLGKFLAR